MSTGATTAEAGAFIHGSAHRSGGPPLPITNPADGQVFAEPGLEPPLRFVVGNLYAIHINSH